MLYGNMTKNGMGLPSWYKDEEVVNMFENRLSPNLLEKLELIRILLAWVQGHQNVTSIQAVETASHAWTTYFNAKLNKQICCDGLTERVRILCSHYYEFRCFIKVPGVYYDIVRNVITTTQYYFNGESFVASEDGTFESPTRHYFRLRGCPEFQLQHFIFDMKKLALFLNEYPYEPGSPRLEVAIQKAYEGDDESVESTFSNLEIQSVARS